MGSELLLDQFDCWRIDTSTNDRPQCSRVMSGDADETNLQWFVDAYGEGAVIDILRRSLTSKRDELTILTNSGVHHLPPEQVRGQLVVASEGTLDLSSAESVHREYQAILSRLAKILKSQNWRRIYLAPAGPPTLSMQIKLLVFRITRLETIDLLYDGKGGYVEVFIEQRPLIVSDVRDGE